MHPRGRQNSYDAVVDAALKDKTEVVDVNDPDNYSTQRKGCFKALTNDPFAVFRCRLAC